MSQNYLMVNVSSLSDASLRDRLKDLSGDNHQFADNLINLLAGLASGTEAGRIDYNHGGVAASETITIVAADVDAGDEIVIGSVVFTAVSGSPSDNEYQIDAMSDTVTASRLAAAINASSDTSSWLSASSALGVVTVSSKLRGAIGNLVGLQLGSGNTGTGITLGDVGLTGGDDSSLSTFKYGVA